MPDPAPEVVSRLADRFSAIGNDARLRIMRMLLAAHPNGLTVGEIGAELAMPGSTLSHHLEKLRHETLVNVIREGTFLRYTANAATLQELLAFLFVECCTRTAAVKPEAIVRLHRGKEIR